MLLQERMGERACEIDHAQERETNRTVRELQTRGSWEVKLEMNPAEEPRPAVKYN